MSTVFLMLLISALILVLYSQFKVKRTFNKFSRVQGAYGYKGSDVAKFILEKNGITNVKVERTPGTLTDHYDPVAKVVRLSSDVHDSTSLSAVAVAAHEVGHAIQDANDYSFLRFRHRMVPLVNFTAKFTWILVIAGIAFNMTGMLDVGIAFFSIAVLFQVITLPVEFDASKRAMVELQNNGLIATAELRGSQKVLNAAALTYVAAMIYSVIELLRLIAIRNN